MNSLLFTTGFIYIFVTGLIKKNIIELFITTLWGIYFILLQLYWSYCGFWGSLYFI